LHRACLWAYLLYGRLSGLSSIRGCIEECAELVDLGVPFEQEALQFLDVLELVGFRALGLASGVGLWFLLGLFLAIRGQHLPVQVVIGMYGLNEGAPVPAILILVVVDVESDPVDEVAFVKVQHLTNFADAQLYGFSRHLFVL
jgi:hypothetical protein